MARAAPIQTSFAAGELSPRLNGRVDLAKYHTGLARLENMIALPHGGVTRRAGTRFVAHARDDAHASRLIPFEFSAEQAYMLEFGHHTLRIYRDRGQIFVPPTAATVENGTFAAGIAGWTDASAPGGSIGHDGWGQRLRLAGPGGIARQSIATQPGMLHVLRFRTDDAAAYIRIGSAPGWDDFVRHREIAPGWHTAEFVPTSWQSWIDLGNHASGNVHVDEVSVLSGQALELPTPYGAHQLAALKFVQSADMLFLAHGEVKVHCLARTGHSSWSLGPMAFEDGPYLPENANDDHKIAWSGAVTMRGAVVSVTASGFQPFSADDIGRHIRIKHGSKWGWATIVAVSAGDTAEARIGGELEGANGGVPATASWRLGAWTQSRGWPRAIAFFEQRLFLAGTAAQPQTLWGSCSAEYRRFSPTKPADTEEADHLVTDDSGLTYTIASERVNAIRWLTPARDLLIGTIGGEFRLSPASGAGALAPANVLLRQETNHGAADIQPVRVASSILFVKRARRKLRELAFSFDIDGYVAPDLSLLAEHLTAPGLAAIAHQQEPDGVVWAARTDGLLVGMTYDKAQQVIGWHRHPMAGQVDSLAIIPSSAGGADELWLCVRRTVGGMERRFIEVLVPQGFDVPEDAFFVDAGLTYDGRNRDGARRLSLQGAGSWQAGANKVLAATGFAPFANPETGQLYRLADATGNRVSVQVSEVVDGTRAIVRLGRAVPESLRDRPTAEWARLTRTVGGATHLAGTAVDLLVDGAAHAPRIVSADGRIELDAAAAVVHAGLRAGAVLETVRLEAGAADGTAQGKTKRIDRVTLRLQDSLGPRAGPASGHLEPIPARSSADPMDRPPALMSGDVTMEWPGGFETEARLRLEQPQPVPLTVLAIMPRLTTFDG